MALPLTPVRGFAIFISRLAVGLGGLPFDDALAESELVMGYASPSTQGFRFLFFFLSRSSQHVLVSCHRATLFLGGYAIWGLDPSNLLSPVILFAKVGVLLFLMIWLRWTLPRLREDQLQTLAWKWLIPISMAGLILNGVVQLLARG